MRFAALAAILIMGTFPLRAAPARERDLPRRPAVKGLSRDVARARARRVSGVRYALLFRLDTEGDVFSGRATIRFDLKGADRPLTVDFAKGTIGPEGLSVNGKAAAPEYNGLFLTLPPGSLREGPNEVAIAFSHPYSEAGPGLYRFRAPIDGKVYVYTDFEPYDANNLFPCFDQPDIKATYALTVEAPAYWQVISAVSESEIMPGPGGRRVWTFPESQRFSTYLFSLHAGPYVVWKSSADGIPLRLFARRAIARHVNVAEWMTITKQGLAFYNEYFDYPYPFGKYDQIIVPDFGGGAMENVAAVTFGEDYVHRGKATWKDRVLRADLILHEMSHMWFGNLVTMKWWDDLWLNESFATYLTYVAMREATEFKDAWQFFHLDTKQWAYWEDQLVTTHPVEADVPDTQEAFANFDGIAYAKGASVLKQAAYYLGGDRFRDGVRRYFKEHAYGNADRTDFIAALEEASGRKLDSWTRQWLRTAGVNTVRAEFSCQDGAVSSFRLAQEAPDGHPTLREHRTRIAFFSGPPEGPLRARTVLPEVGYAGASTPVQSLVGESCPVIVYPNQEDHDYVKVRLDPRSLLAVKARLADVEDDLDRAMLWLTLWNMVEDAELSVIEYCDLVNRHLPRERSYQTLAAVLKTIHFSTPEFSSALMYLSGDGPPWESLRERYVARFEELLWEKLEKAEPGTDEQTLWFDSFVRVAASEPGLRRIAEMLDGGLAFPGLEIDPDRRWGIVHRINRLGAPEAKRLVEAELERDGTRRGQTAAIRAEACRPDWNAKKKWLDMIAADEPGRPFPDLKEAMESVFPYGQDRFRRRFAGDFYARLKVFAGTKPKEFLRSYAENLVPAACDKDDVRALGAFIGENPDLPPVVLKALRVAKQEAERCLKVRALARAGR
ncbi:MAG: aminopeptidase N [Elusimicrobiota bacterium]